MIVARVIKSGKPFKSSIFRDEIKAEAKEIQKDMLDDFKRTTKTWKHQPEFSAKVDYGSAVGGVRIQIATDDPIYKYIDEGTKVRYATMTRDFQAKTEPNVILSTPGKGGVLFVNKKRPRPGIKARKFTKIIAKSYKPEFSRRIKNALERAARRSGHSISK